MDRHSGLPNAALEVLNRHDTARVIRSPIRPRTEDATHIVELRQRISLAPVVIGPRRLRKPTVFLGIAYRSGCSAYEFRGLTNRKGWFAAVISARAPRRVSQFFEHGRSPTGERRDRYQSLRFFYLKSVRHMPTFRN
jgi:hypothetical protein